MERNRRLLPSNENLLFFILRIRYIVKNKWI